jgi:hypothetical protein
VLFLLDSVFFLLDSVFILFDSVFFLLDSVFFLFDSVLILLDSVHTSVGIRCLLIGRVHIPVAAIHPRASVVMIWQHHMRAEACWHSFAC